MKKLGLVTLLVAALAGMSVLALDEDVRYKLNTGGDKAFDVQLGTQIEHRTKGVARIVYDATKFGAGVSTGSTARARLTTQGSVYTGVDLPAGAILEKSWFQTVTPFVDSGFGARLEVHCSERSNIVSDSGLGNTAWTSLTANQIVQGAVDNSVELASVRRVASSCKVYSRVRNWDFSAGKAIIFVEYTVGE